MVWAEDDWFAQDRAGAVTVTRKDKGRKPLKSRSRRPEKKAAPSRRAPKEIAKKTPGYFPGTFFGFTAPTGEPQGTAAPVEPDDAAPVEPDDAAPIEPDDAAPIEPAVGVPAGAAKSAPRKKRRYARRKKKRSTTGKETPTGESSAS